MKKLYKFYWDCGRQGELEGIFIAEDTDVQAIIGKYIDFGEVLGKHSDIEGVIEAADIEEKSANQDVIRILEECFGTPTISGYNPLEYMEWEDEEDEEDER